MPRSSCELQKIIEAAREHLPALLQPGKKPKLLKGAEFRTTIDSMKLVEPRPAKLDSVQVNTQRLIGSLKCIALLHPRFSLALHRLSCVMSAPPHVAYEVAKAVLAEAYAERDIGITYGGSGHASSPRLGGAHAGGCRR